MLQLRPSCECCDKDLPPDATDARICSFECTFCADCVDQVLFNVCPNCGGGFVPRPIRPSQNRRGGYWLGNYPASTERVTRVIDRAAHSTFAADLRKVPPELR